MPPLNYPPGCILLSKYILLSMAPQQLNRVLRNQLFQDNSLNKVNDCISMSHGNVSRQIDVIKERLPIVQTNAPHPEYQMAEYPSEPGYK